MAKPLVVGPEMAEKLRLNSQGKKSLLNQFYGTFTLLDLQTDISPHQSKPG